MSIPGRSYALRENAPLILLVFLFPVAVYLLILAIINRGPHPVLIRGTWDVLGLLFALSGFLFFGGPAILNGMYEQRRLAWALGHSDFLPGVGDGAWLFWLAFWLVYFGVVFFVVWWMVTARRPVTSIYNVALEPFAAALEKTLAALRIECRQAEQRLYLQRDADSAPSVIDVEAFPLLHHVSLTWREDPLQLREAFEQELTHVLADTEAPEHLTWLWMLSTSICLFAVSFFGTVLLFLGMVTRLVLH